MLACVAAASDLAASAGQPDSWLFDAGGEDSVLEAEAVRLGLELGYNPDRGYGWVAAPEASFSRPELGRSRDRLTIDGVEGEHLEFRVDLDPGRWWVTAWMEADPHGDNWPKASANGTPLNLGWQSFRRNVEPSRGPPRLYRVLHQPVDCPEGEFRLSFQAEESVRLLGLSIIREDESGLGANEGVTKALEDAGRYDSSASLSRELERITNSGSRNENDAWLKLQQLRCRMLMSAEELFATRGWHWADREYGIGMFDRQYQLIALLDGLLAAGGNESLWLEGRARFLRGRALYWLDRERSSLAERTSADRDLGLLYEKHPDNSILAMYRGEQIALPCPCDGIQKAEAYDAPRWSWMQLEALCRMRRIAHWWTLHRQSDTGEFGGKLGDDVELLRWWSPLCLSGDRVALQGWQRLADGVWNSGKVHLGYSAKVSDVEHAAELIADTAPLMAVYRDDPQYQDRLEGSARLFEELWTAKTVGGRRFFRSAWFSATEIDTTGRRARDVEYNTRAAQAVRYLAWRRRDPEATEALHEWASAWAHAAMRTDKGKPKGVVPASVRFSDESINGDGPNWHEADMYWHYYDWDTYCGSLVLDQLLFSYLSTGDERLLEPMHHCLSLVHKWEGRTRDGEEPGSAEWAAEKLSRQKTFWRVVEQWRFCTGDTRWDDLVRRYGSPFGRFRVTGDESHLYTGLVALLNNLRYNTPLKTTEALYTDRVNIRGWQVLKAMLTGDGVTNNISPHQWITWEQTDEWFSALVSDSGPGRMTVHLFSHATEPTEVVARLWKPLPGQYRFTRREAGATPDISTYVLQDLGQRLRVPLPSRKLVTLTWERQP